MDPGQTDPHLAKKRKPNNKQGTEKEHAAEWGRVL
jgi:hypothetical protein